MTTKYRLTSLSAENCAVEIQSKMQELYFFQSKTHCLSTLFHQKTKKKITNKNTAKKNNRKKNCFLTSLVIICNSNNCKDKMDHPHVRR